MAARINAEGNNTSAHTPQLSRAPLWKYLHPGIDKNLAYQQNVII